MFHTNKTSVLLLSGWLFADLLLGLMVIFLAALPGKPPEAPILIVNKSVMTQQDAVSPCQSDSNSNVLYCTVKVTVSESDASLVPVTWHLSSDVADNVQFSPAGTTLTPGTGQEVSISHLPCQNGSLVFSGSSNDGTKAQPVAVSWQCTTPIKHVDFTSHRLILTNIDYQGLLNDSQGAIEDIKQKILNQYNGQGDFQGHTVALAMIYGGSPDADGAGQAQQVAQKVCSDAIEQLKNESPIFQYTACYDNDDHHTLYTSIPPADNFSTVVMDIYLYTF